MSVYKVRMLVLTMVTANDPDEAKDMGNEIATEAGLTVLQIEEPDLASANFPYGSVEEDIYP